MDKEKGVPEYASHRSAATSRRKSNSFRQVLIALLALPSILLGLYSVFAPKEVTLESLYEAFIHGKHTHRPHHLFGKAAEKKFLSVPDETSANKALRQYASKPHMAGTAGDLDTAIDFLRLLQDELGITAPKEEPIFSAGSSESQHATLSIPKARRPYAWIDKYYPFMNSPLEQKLQIVDDDGATIWTADLNERSDDMDPEAKKYATAISTFHGLSCGGDVTGTLVYGNYCTQEDYQKLVDKKVSLDGKIVLCRYGGIFRGLKVKGGQELGAVGVLIYSDPRDDGTVTVDRGYKPYPHGPARNPTSVQRGSVQFLSYYPGDPTTPGYPSYENSTRTEGSNIPSIPSIPISWANAEHILKTLKGGHLKGKKIRMVNKVDDRVIPIWNTMGVIPGHIRNEVVIVGNHRDAWVMGGVDPSSGTASVNEVVRGLGELLRNGWKPLRTIVIASWDAEEYGLIGSTEWGEDFPEWISKHVVAYVNLDSSVSGSKLSFDGSPLLAHFVRRIAEELPHPTDKNRTMWDATTDNGELFGLQPANSDQIDEEVLAMQSMKNSAADAVGVSLLGSGSDYTVFLQRNGIPSTNGGFSGTIHDPVYHYHSIFDSVVWQERYGDPGFHRHVAVSKHLGLQVLRLASSITLPFNTTHYAYELESYLNKVEGLASENDLTIKFKSLRKSIKSLQSASHKLDAEKHAAEKELKDLIARWKKHRKQHAKKLRKIICKVRKALGHKCKCPHKKNSMDDVEDDIDYGLYMSINNHRLHESFNARFTHEHRHENPFKELRRIIKRIQNVNEKLSSFERGFISSEGIRDREWFKHLGVAPGKWLGYGATTLPALTEALTFEKDVTLAQQEAKRLEKHIDRLADVIAV